jgi:hypothetical protein
VLVIVLAEAGEHGVWAFVRERVSAYRKAGRGRVGIAGRGQLAVSILRHRLKERVQSRDELDIPRRVLDGHGSTECQARVRLGNLWALELSRRPHRKRAGNPPTRPPRPRPAVRVVCLGGDGLCSKQQQAQPAA